MSVVTTVSIADGTKAESLASVELVESRSMILVESRSMILVEGTGLPGSVGPTTFEKIGPNGAG
jgi:hypothetical protein